MLHAVNRAVSTFRQPHRWEELVKRALQFDFGWDGPAKQYIGLYRKIAKG
jgi:starch synthase